MITNVMMSTIAYHNSDSLISTEELASLLGQPNLHVIEAGFTMPGTTPTARESFEQAHIPHALFFDIDEVADRQSSLPHMLPSVQEFAKHVGNLGIGTGDRVIVYDREGLKFAPRVWWTFVTFGHNIVAVLNGGLVKWQAEGRPLQRGTASPREPKEFVATFSPYRVRNKQDVFNLIDTRSEQLIDARSKGRFDGTAPEVWPGRRAGHIPTSLNLPFDQLADSASHTVVPQEQIEALFRKAGADLSKPVVTSCGSGVTACVLAFALHLAGKSDVAVYDGSWAEWGLPGDTPVASAK